jgi:hypothetical protein
MPRNGKQLERHRSELKRFVEFKLTSGLTIDTSIYDPSHNKSSGMSTTKIKRKYIKNSGCMRWRKTQNDPIKKRKNVIRNRARQQRLIQAQLTLSRSKNRSKNHDSSSTMSNLKTTINEKITTNTSTHLIHSSEEDIPLGELLNARKKSTRNKNIMPRINNETVPQKRNYVKKNYAELFTRRESKRVAERQARPED